MTGRLTTGVLVSALLRRVQAAGGHGAVLARGDREAGALVLVCADRGRLDAVLELSRGLDGRAAWRPVAERVVSGAESVGDYVDRRRRTDPDLWAVELDIADATRLAAETIASR